MNDIKKRIVLTTDDLDAEPAQTNVGLNHARPAQRIVLESDAFRENANCENEHSKTYKPIYIAPQPTPPPAWATPVQANYRNDSSFFPNRPAITTVVFAGFWSRVGAYLIDLIIIVLIMMIVGFLIGITGITSSIKPDSKAEDGFYNIIGFVFSWFYYAFFESSVKQATPGKKAMGLYVQGTNGQRLSVAKATGRFFGKILSGLFFGIGYIMVAFTAKKQGLHDMMAGTVVVKGTPLA